MVKNCYKLLKMGIQRNGGYLFARDYKRLHQVVAKRSTWER